MKIEDDIHTLVNIPKVTTMPNYIASRKPCKEFYKYKELFIKCQYELKIGNFKLIKFQNERIEKGDYFVLNGVLLYVLDIGKSYKKNGNVNARLKLIFENSTYSDMLLRSLSAELYKHGKKVDRNNIKILNNDVKNGYIYVLKSLSNDDRITTKRNLYKIGFSTTSVEERVKNTKLDPTYLMADVEIKTSFEVYNINPHKLEKLIHKFFHNSCLDIDIVDGKGDIYKPREWFIVPLTIIERVIELIINGQIINYRYDTTNETISKKTSDTL